MDISLHYFRRISYLLLLYHTHI